MEQDAATSAGQKRIRPERNKSHNDTVKNEDSSEEANVLTPHTLRLLKLVQEGSTEHAQLAACQLEVLTAGSSPVVLWDILGRLQYFLTSHNWKTRHNASVAMEGVAKHLPVLDQEHFLQESHKTVGNEQHLWLTLSDLQGRLPVILEKGRLLLASAETKYDQHEDDELERLDQNLQGREDFCQQRIQLQRTILARRLGFSDILSQFSGKDVKSAVSGEDLVPNIATSTTSQNEKTKKRKRTNAASQTSVRALLVMEIQQQQGETNVVSHRNSQSLLATELIYRMFDASWQVRHGSLMGILALMRAWKVHQSKGKFGIWPQDILARCLCVLSLERFGDYSGASSMESGGMVSPVREMAGQVFSVVFLMAPTSLQKEACEILAIMKGDDDWEVRHGALVALKYSVALMGNAPDDFDDWPITFLTRAFILAKESLADQSDDIQSVAAQLLSTLFARYVKGVQLDQPNISLVARPLWKSLEQSRLVSSSIKDLVGLFSMLVSENCSLVLQAISDGKSKWDSFRRILERLNELLGCEYTSVKCSIIRAIGSIATHLSANISASEVAIDEKHSEMANSFCQIVESSYDMYFAHILIFDEKCTNQDLESFIKLCRESWALLAKASKHILAGSSKRRSDLEMRLILRYFNLHLHSRMGEANGVLSKLRDLAKSSFGRLLRLRLDLANAVAEFLVGDPFAKRETSHEMLELCVCACFDSPFTSQCEAACFLFGALSNRLDRTSSIASPVQGVLENCQEVLCRNIQGIPLCIIVENSKVLDSIPTLPSLLLDSFSCGVEMVKERGARGNAAAEAVVQLWRGIIESKTLAQQNGQNGKGNITLDSMRLSVSLTGALVAGGYHFLPPKLTPLIRALMTSVQNERDDVCRIHGCSHLTGLIGLLSSSVSPEKADGFTKTHSKMLNNLCKLITSNTEPGCVAAARVVGSLVGNLPADASLRGIEPIWNALSTLSEYEGEVIHETQEALYMLQAVCKGLQRGKETTSLVIESILCSVVVLSIKSPESHVREYSSKCVKSICAVDESLALLKALPTVANFLKDSENDSYRVRGCQLLRSVLETASVSICPFVRSLLPLAMSLMTDPIELCAKTAATIFSLLVQVAPLVQESVTLSLVRSENDHKADLVMDHLIHGKALPPCDIHPTILGALKAGGVSLRGYQMEGVSWLRFLQTVGLNGALCDSMGLGKTLQALLGMAMSHLDASKKENPKSLVVCPSSVVGHWMREVERFFPGQEVFRAVALTGTASQRKSLWDEGIGSCNLVVTSYSILRSDIGRLSERPWRYCILDEGHLLKNPKTATARASRQLRSRHKLMLTGTPVQNKVHEVWATFDFLMPNFLGSSSSFSKEFARPITKSQLPGASASDVGDGMEKLKVLHQQVLPFILRREKEQVLQELPPKCITTIPCDMSSIQTRLYHEFCSGEQARKSLSALQRTLEKTKNLEGNALPSLGSNVLKSLLYLRLLCTHPSLVKTRTDQRNDQDDEELCSIECSGKLVALSELLRNAGIQTQELTAADNDSSLLYCDDDDDDDRDEVDDVLELSADATTTTINDKLGADGGSRCLIFAQFTHSLDVVEEFLLKRHMPAVRYVRLDGRVPSEKRADIADMFNRDESIKIMLLTTRIGGLGLNLTGADTVIFLEHDWNPHADLQSMDRAHRIGQKKTVNVYKLVTSGSIEEKIMKLHETKIAMSNAIVNADNSTMFSMGTDRLLDIFRFRSEVGKGQSASNDMEDTLDALVERYEDEYTSLSVGEFISGFEGREDSPDAAKTVKSEEADAKEHFLKK